MTVQEILAAIEAEQVVMKGILAKENLSEEEEKELETRGEKIKGLQTRAKGQAVIDEADRNKPGVLITEKRGDTADLEWRTKCQEFSLRKAVLQATGQRVDAGAEIEVSEEIARRSGNETEGVSVPWDVFKVPVSNELRAAASNISTALPSGHVGANIIADNLLGGQFIDILRDSMMVVGLGARMISGLKGDVQIPKQHSSVSAHWVSGEDDAITTSGLGIDQLTMSPKTVGSLSQFTYKMLLQSTPDIEQLVRSDMAQVLGRAIDRAVVLGTGANDQPTGLTNSAGIHTGSSGTNGGAPTYSRLLGLIREIWGNNLMATGFLTNSAVVGTLMSTLKSSADTASNYVMNDKSRLLNLPVRMSEAVPGDGSKGTGSNLSTIICGDFSQIFIGQWGDGFSLLINPYAETAYTRLSVMVRAHASMDTVLRHPEGFAMLNDVVTN